VPTTSAPFLTADASLRLSSLEDEAATQVILPHASLLLDPTTLRSRSPSREATEGLLRARVSPLRYHLAHRVIGLETVRSSETTNGAL